MQSSESTSSSWQRGSEIAGALAFLQCVVDRGHSCNHLGISLYVATDVEKC